MDKTGNHAPFETQLQMLRKEDRDRYLTAIMCPASARPDFVAFALFNLELARATDLVREPLLGQIRLQWWREIIQSGGAIAKSRQNPLETVAILETIMRIRPEIRPMLLRMIDARETELEKMPFPTFEAFCRQADESVGNLLRSAIFTSEDRTIANEPLDRAISAVAIAYAIAGRLRNCSYDAAQGRMRLPLDVIERQELRAPDFLAAMQVGESKAQKPEIALIASEIALEGKKALAEVRYFRWPHNCWPAILTARLARLHLLRLERFGFQLSNTRLAQRDPLDVWKLLWTRITGKI